MPATPTGPPLENIRHIFFDLDNTLWDFDGNSEATLADLYVDFRLAERGVASYPAFFARYQMHNRAAWKAYREGRTVKERLRIERFARTFADYGIEDLGLAYAFSDSYLSSCPLQPGLLPNAINALEHLKDKYRMHIITNGFEEVQAVKMRHSGLERYFEQVICSEQAGALKPSHRIFLHALERAGTTAGESLYIGDKPAVDGLPAVELGMAFIWFRPGEGGAESDEAGPDWNFEHCIADLGELIGML